MKKRYELLDGLRGVAALCVVIRHTDAFWGRFEMPYSDLAVDLFFILSGFVIALAYERRLAGGMSVKRFILKVRLPRLYPLYILGAGIGFVGAAAAAFLSSRSEWTVNGLMISTLCTIFMLPAPLRHAVPYAYPLNTPAWSLFFELIANAVYALVWRWLTTPVLAVVVVLSAVASVLATQHFGEFGTGWSLDNFWGGLPRVSVSFFAGVLMFRVYRGASWRGAAWPLLLVLPILFLAPKAWGAPYQMACAFIALPAIVWAGIHLEPGSLAPVYAFLGTISYPIYAIHAPLYRLIKRVVEKFEISLSTPAAGIAYVVALIGIAALLDRLYDGPVRAWLTQARGARSGTAPGAGPVGEGVVP